MSTLTPDELARLRLKAKHGTLTPEEQRAYNDYATEQLSAVPSPPSGAVPPKKGFKWESEKVAEWRLKHATTALMRTSGCSIRITSRPLRLPVLQSKRRTRHIAQGGEVHHLSRCHLVGIVGSNRSVQHFGLQAVRVESARSLYVVSAGLRVDRRDAEYK